MCYHSVIILYLWVFSCVSFLMLHIWLNLFIFIYKSLLFYYFNCVPCVIKTTYISSYVIIYHYFSSHFHQSFTTFVSVLSTGLVLNRQGQSYFLRHIFTFKYKLPSGWTIWLWLEDVMLPLFASRRCHVHARTHLLLRTRWAASRVYLLWTLFPFFSHFKNKNTKKLLNILIRWRHRYLILFSPIWYRLFYMNWRHTRRQDGIEPGICLSFRIVRNKI
jgi:hypothetical protein